MACNGSGGYRQATGKPVRPLPGDRYGSVVRGYRSDTRFGDAGLTNWLTAIGTVAVAVAAVGVALFAEWRADKRVAMSAGTRRGWLVSALLPCMAPGQSASTLGEWSSIA
jgi:hypothetical protein